MSNRDDVPSALELTRRELLKLAGGAAALAPLAGIAGAAPAGAAPAAAATVAAAPRFFTAAEFRLLDELTELIIPTDEHSPGARAAEVAAYIDRKLAEYDPSIAELKEARDSWKAGLGAIDALSKEMNGAAIMDVPEEKRVAVLERLAKKEKSAETPAEKFFGELKGWTGRGYYTSKIGIHQEMEYKGNVLQNEFAGIDAESV
jgi:gluconate 2-dehydrogenase gamma chain